MACIFVKILSTSVCTVIKSLKQHLCSLIVWKHKSPFLLVEKCTCFKGNPPAGGQCLQEPTEESLGGFAICCPSCLFEHIHLLLASPRAAAGTSHTIMGMSPPSFSFPVVSLLVIWHSWGFFQHPPLKHKLYAKLSMHLSVRLLSSVAIQLFSDFWPLLWSTTSLLGGSLFLSDFLH